MRIAVRIGIIAFGLLVAFAAYEAARNPMGPPEVVEAQRAVSRHMANQAVGTLGTGGGWSKLTVETADLNSFIFALDYAVRPDSVEKDTKSVVAAMLYQLTLASHHPNSEHTEIVARAQFGSDPLGVARYDFRRDTVVFEPPVVAP